MKSGSRRKKSIFPPLKSGRPELDGASREREKVDFNLRE
jgi:hypothetical protein